MNVLESDFLPEQEVCSGNLFEHDFKVLGCCINSRYYDLPYSAIPYSGSNANGTQEFQQGWTFGEMLKYFDIQQFDDELIEIEIAIGTDRWVNGKPKGGIHLYQFTI